QLDLALSKESLANARLVADPEALAGLKERFSFQYPHAALKGLYTKTTVSELKIAAMSEKDEAAFHAFEERETESYVPEFRRSGREITGTVRGNAYHRVMELMDFVGVYGRAVQMGSMEQTKDTETERTVAGMLPDSYEAFQKTIADAEFKRSIEEFLASQVKALRLSEEYRSAVRIDKICEFLKTELGYRMLRAQAQGRLWREQPFVLSIPATRLKEGFPSEETVLIQGIIDAYFIEEDEIVLLDYKTDSVESMDALWTRYGTQMDHYQEALQRLTGKNVKKKILYSFSLGKY
ncbi:MAG: PD-(D/E)XK nuclease family protein, partial [Lachnospiraceae bacterium]|nr:PD-(D/E)XK nuclease family protein [Lachnospiraceae bacterium]